MLFNNETRTGKIIKRYKRFLADIELSDGQEITAHTPNTGSMKTCWLPGQKVLLSHSANEKRKYPYTLEMVHNGKTWIGINTHKTNLIVEEGLNQEKFPELKGPYKIQREKKTENGRLDFYLESLKEGVPNCYVEVKNVTYLHDQNLGQFPDAKSERGTKHLNELMKLHGDGNRCVMLFIVQREDIKKFEPAWSIDPVYSKTLKKAYESGVEILVYRCKLSLKEIVIDSKLPFSLVEKEA